MYNLNMTISEKTKEKLRDLGVGIVYLFGSRATGTAFSNSDYDIGVVFLDYSKKIDMEIISSIYSTLNEEFPDKIRGPKLDISYLQNANAALQVKAINEGIVLFESDSNFRANYEEEVVKRYDDYRFLQNNYAEATFAAFSR
jgi:uncharacterized protein